MKLDTFEKMIEDVPIEPMVIVLVGEPGVGKSSFALRYMKGLKPLYIPAEKLSGVFDNLPADQVPKQFRPLPKPTDNDPMAPLTALKKYCMALLETDHDYKLIVIDTGSAIDSLLETAICKDQKVKTIKAAYGGYNRGMDVLAGYWVEIMDLIERMRSEKELTVLLNFHPILRKVRNSPTEEEYNAHDLDAAEKCVAEIVRNVDAVLFYRMKVRVNDVVTDPKTGAVVRGGKIKTMADRQLITDASGMIGYGKAKNRHSLDSLIDLNSRNADFNLLRFFPYYAYLFEDENK